MMQTLNSSKTAEILARYRPIAPKPPDNDLTDNNTNTNSNPSGMPEKIRDSGYVRSVWPHHEARPTQSRKRGRALLGPRRSKHSYAFSPYVSPKSLSAFLASPNVVLPNYTMAASTVQATVKDLDLNMHVPVEKDLLKQLQAKEVQVQSGGVVAPRPVKLVSSAITVHPQTVSNQEVAVQSRSKAKEIEDEVESEALPAVISDSKNKVRLANSAYNKLVGQPECCWLDSIARGTGGDGCGGKAVTCHKICGEVRLQLPDTGVEEFVSTSNGFFCLVVIEWGNSECKSSITTIGEAVRLFCESRDYMFAWRFHTQGPVTAAPGF
ncbi:NADH-ubiquinone oxidoreductase-related-like protein [Heracleum sosnowskyi]|uniref:NADH-ubiquinone oxidoreductase-related-like protein n=1 Tax=Heracleum sosnowskyi TaxID=360622 RepID=A0AAD8NEY3_9APIA|nr:NADH-ubiquinone oxidoreductase-related-like protein [Heracleum sosnowskyi]